MNLLKINRDIGSLQTSVGSDVEIAAVERQFQMNGPASVCDSNRYNLFREDRRYIICSNKNRDPTTTPTTLPPPLQNKKNFVFYHIPKTGGESLEKVLGIGKNHVLWKVRHARGDDREDTIAFTIIRNPFDRMLSWFRFCLHGWRASDIQGNHTAASVSNAFEEWLENVCLVLLSPTDIGHWITYNYFEYLGGMLPLHVDYIIRFEHYAEDYALLAEALGIEKELVKENSSTENSDTIDPTRPYNKENKVSYNPQVAELLKKNYQEIYTERAREFVEMKYGYDLHFFNYTF
eukprot:15366829-Ditylum_brightwellii.AAC.1